MKTIKVLNAKAHDHWASEPIEHWARYTFDLDLKCPDNTIDFVESFNGKIERYMYKPMCTLLEEVKKKFMKMIYKRFEIASEWPGKVHPRVKSLLVTAKKESQ